MASARYSHFRYASHHHIPLALSYLHLLPQLWHATDAIKDICLGKVGFDVRLAHKHGVRQLMLDSVGVGGHVYGRGAYFAEYAIYPHWWFCRNQPEVDADGVPEYSVILAQVFTGRSKDFGSSWAPELCVEPAGYHSVRGTESNQRLPAVVRPSPPFAHPSHHHDATIGHPFFVIDVALFFNRKMAFHAPFGPCLLSFLCLSNILTLISRALMMHMMLPFSAGIGRLNQKKPLGQKTTRKR